MKEIRKCSECFQKTSRLTRGRYVGEAKHDGKSYRIDLPDLQFYRCENCKAEVIPDDADRQIGRELRRLAGLLTPEEIRDARLRAGFSQKSLAEYLNVAEATVCRWETGGQIQQGGYDNSIRSFFCVPGVAEFYGSLRDGNRPPLTETISVAGVGGLGSASAEFLCHANHPAMSLVGTRKRIVNVTWSWNSETGEDTHEVADVEATDETEWSPGPPANRITRYLPVLAGC